MKIQDPILDNLTAHKFIKEQHVINRKSVLKTALW